MEWEVWEEGPWDCEPGIQVRWSAGTDGAGQGPLALYHPPSGERPQIPVYFVGALPFVGGFGLLCLARRGLDGRGCEGAGASIPVVTAPG